MSRFSAKEKERMDGIFYFDIYYFVIEEFDGKRDENFHHSARNDMSRSISRFFFFFPFLFSRRPPFFRVYDAKHVFNRSPRPLSNFDVFYDPFYASFSSSFAPVLARRKEIEDFGHCFVHNVFEISTYIYNFAF